MNRLLFGQTTLLITVFFALETSFLLFDFYFNRLTQFLTKKEFEIFGGISPSRALKILKISFFLNDPT